VVRYLNATVKIYVKTSTQNDEGTRISSYGYLVTPKTAAAETLRADVQPYKLTEAEMTLYGIDDDGADTRRMFYNTAAYVKIGNRAEVTGDYDGVTKYFDIMPINVWQHHGECLLVPVAGE
jgi:hypothetical protein